MVDIDKVEKSPMYRFILVRELIEEIIFLRKKISEMEYKNNQRKNDSK